MQCREELLLIIIIPNLYTALPSSRFQSTFTKEGNIIILNFTETELQEEGSDLAKVAKVAQG